MNPPVLRLRLDESTGRGEAVPLVLNTVGDGRRSTTVEATVSSTTGRTALATGKKAAGRKHGADVRVAGENQAVVWVTPRSAGSPLEPTDRLRVSTPHGESTVDVWIEPIGGRWYDGDFRNEEGRPTKGDLGIVAMHAALMGTTADPRILMFSAPRLRKRNGEPLEDPMGVAGQWSWFGAKLNDVEAKVLDVHTGTTRDTLLPDVTLPRHHPPRPWRDNIFCAGAAHFPDGTLFVVGGNIAPDIFPENDGVIENAHHMYAYEAGTDTWTLLPANIDPYRWYPTVTTLPDGRMLITTGSKTVLDAAENTNDKKFWDNIINDYRIYDPATGSMVDTGEVDLIDTSKLGTTPNGWPEVLGTYPWVFVLPRGSEQGTIIALTECNRAWLYEYAPQQQAPLVRAPELYRMKSKGSRSYPTYGSMVLLPLTPGQRLMRILAVGGQGEHNGNHRDLSPDHDATATAEIFEVDTTKSRSGQGRWRDPKGPRKRMAHARVLCDATLLADGTVLVTGGSKTGWGDQNREEVRQAELFDPERETFTRAARAKTDRRYHSTALLQLDGTVLKAGSSGGFGNNRKLDNGKYDISIDPKNRRAWTQVHTDAERYFPPYLWRGPRPSVHDVAGQAGGATLRYGDGVEITASGLSLDDDVRVAIIRLGSTTHGNDMDQRYVWLPVDRREQHKDQRWTITVTPPRNPAAAPPGDYQLIVVDGHGVPSEGVIVRMAP
ncbi:galactose oxidase-like domain-containing protein [Streptomyces sp. YGL11-2]|uniref:galactose oxidase-like domain-containing protein n=1 Tax=Streptomyces sp. YGL11-2 TaxID=3414028 RepID=UPI003CEA9D6C